MLRFPPSKKFNNQASGKAFEIFFSKEILKHLKTGALRVWGKVSDSPPHLVLPLTVEPTKPRLCLDSRLLNIWMTDAPFSLDRLSDGELVTTQRPWSILLENRGQENRFSAATTTAVIYCVLSLLVDLRYTIGITKSVLYPTPVWSI